MKQRLLALLFIVQLLPLGVWAALAVDDTFEVNGMTFKVTSIEPLEVQVGIGKSGSPAIDISTEGGVVIPATVTGTDGNSYSVTAIGSHSFRQCKNLTTITIPNSVNSIGASAFSYCEALTSISIPSSVDSIANSAFASSGLTSVIIPNTVKSIGINVFRNTTWYKGLPDGPVYKDNVLLEFKGRNPEGIIQINEGTRLIAGGVFQNCPNVTSVVIPNSVTCIESQTFNKCTGLQSVSIPNSVTIIERFAFSGCTSLTTIEIPNSVTHIAEYAFDGSGLTSVSIPNSVKTIESGIFHKCTSLISASIPNSVVNIGNSLFMDCSNLKSVDINTTIIPSNTFVRCSSLTEVKLGNIVNTIGDRAFQYCQALPSIVIPNSVTTIDVAAFQYCENLESVVIPNSVKTIGAQAFWGCTRLASITIPESVESIGVAAFRECGLTSFIIPSSVTAIGGSTFAYCGHLTSVVIPNSVKSIGTQAFRQCVNLNNVTIPESVESIENMAFQHCLALESIIIPSSIKSIEENAFKNCNKLSEVTSMIKEPFDIASNCWSGVETTTIPLYVPFGTKNKYETKEGWKEFKNIIEMEAELNPIDGETTLKTDELNGQDLSDNVMGDVYYNVGDNGYDATDQSIVISEATNMGQVTNKKPGSVDVKENFTGIILKVAKGKGVITVNVKTSGNAQLVVQVGNGTPMIASKTEKGDVVVSYDVEEDTYVYIYAILGGSTARATRASSDGEVRIYGISVRPGATGISSIVKEVNADAPIYNLSGQRLSVPSKGVNIIDGKKVVIK